VSDEIIVAEWPLNRRNCMRVVLGSYNGYPIINVRKWFEADDGSIRPTKDGVALALKHLPQLAAAMTAALEIARERGLVTAERSDSGNAAG
jgi:hypothetical protein